jgi:hypothetical protein
VTFLTPNHMDARAGASGHHWRLTDCMHASCRLRQPFDAVLIDEACQATEVAALQPLVRGTSKVGWVRLSYTVACFSDRSVPETLASGSNVAAHLNGAGQSTCHFWRSASLHGWQKPSFHC